MKLVAIITLSAINVVRDCFFVGIYRDFGMDYPSQKLVDEMVALFDDSKKGPSARIDYARVLKNAKNSRKKNVFSKEVRQDLKDMNKIYILVYVAYN